MADVIARPDHAPIAVQKLKEFDMKQSEEILEAALRLPEDDRFQLVTQLLESFPNDSSGLSVDDAELLEELDRRFADPADAVPLSKLWDKD
jgi:putative addiction module component (TIGR02574 family)